MVFTKTHVSGNGKSSIFVAFTYARIGSTTSVKQSDSGSSAIFIRNLHPQLLTNVMSSFKSTKESKSKPALHRSLSYIQKRISSFSLSNIQERISSLSSLCLIITVN